MVVMELKLLAAQFYNSKMLSVSCKEWILFYLYSSIDYLTYKLDNIFNFFNCCSVKPRPRHVTRVKKHLKMTIPRPSEASRESNGQETVGKWSRKSSLVHGTGDKSVIPLGQLKWHLV